MGSDREAYTGEDDDDDDDDDDDEQQQQQYEEEHQEEEHQGNNSQAKSHGESYRKRARKTENTHTTESRLLQAVDQEEIVTFAVD
jgi:FKBP-type peptidyl-prolyl cis-trans isomerase